MMRSLSQTGYWERRGRNPALGAFLGTTLIMALYSIAGNFVVMGYIFGDMARMKTSDWATMASSVYARYRDVILICTMAFEFLFMGGGTLWLFKKWHGLPVRESFRCRAPRSLLAYPLALIGILALLPAVIYLSDIFERAFPIIRKIEESTGQNSLIKATDTRSWILLVLVICFTPALCEEWLFRGYFQGRVGTKLAAPWSYILTGSYFALIHQNYFGLGSLIVVGIYLAFLFETSGSIYPGMIVHFCYNCIILILSNMKKLPLWTFDGSGWIRIPLLLASLPVAALIVFLIVFVSKRASPARHFPSDQSL